MGPITARGTGRMLAQLWLPGLLLLVYAVLRLAGAQPGTDLVGMSAVLRVVFCASGAAVAYLMSLPKLWESLGRPGEGRTRFWALASVVLVALIADDSFMIHETVGYRLGIADSFVLMLYGGPLAALVVFNRKRLSQGAWAFFAVFVALSLIALAGDTFAEHEGTIDVAGFALDFEQICETLGILSLACVFWAQALFEIRNAVIDRPGPAAQSRRR